MIVRFIFSFKILLMLMMVCMTTLTYAQSTTEDSQQESSDTPKITSLPPAYESKMLRLSEVLGALHYLRELCGANEGTKWRQAMQDMIKDEEPTEEQKANMIANFNHGFRGFQETYRECTQAAIEANKRYVAEGMKLSGEIPTRYGR